MRNPYEMELLARLQREDIASEVARIRLAEAAQQPKERVFRKRLAALLVAVASRLAPAAASTGEVGTEMTPASS